MIDFLDFIILGLATWRITNMLVWEDGPFDIFQKFATFSKKWRFLESLFSCVWCLSVWIGAILVLSAIINERVTILIALPFSLSAIAIFITEFIDGKS